MPGLTGLTLLARGGYATVYRAMQESVGREVAVKIENRTLESERDRRRFLREARAAGSMSSHPHVVDLFDAGVCVGGYPYLIMELCQGSYADRIKVASLGADQTRITGVKIADALADAHSLGVLHRDVKPANILVSRFGEPALADFGLAILAETRDMSITLDVLTPAYAPPEMFRHEAPEPGGDVYALCATLYAMLARRPPRWRDGSGPPSIASMIDMFEEPVPDIAGVPGDLMDLLRWGMANEPEARPTAARLRDALAELSLSRAAPDGTTGVPGPALSGGEAEPTQPVAAPDPSTEDETAAVGQPPPPPPPPGHPDPATTSSPFSGRRRWAILAAIGIAEALVALAALGAYVLTGDEGDRPKRTTSDAASASASPAGPATAEQPGFPSVVASDVGTGCPSAVTSAARCPTRPECYDVLVVTGGAASAKRLDCAARHTWEVFAVGELPAAAMSADHRVVASNPQVKEVCSMTTLALVAGFGALNWRTEVLPPTADAWRAGDRTYRCLAGQGTNALVGPGLRTGS
ncbi:MAG: protein kinase [Dactylosporangium sp.]|nr:protein kinase [Dactylosporangium sp.]